MTTRHDNIIRKPGMKRRFINCLKLITPTMKINMSPHARPKVSTRVAKRPEFKVPDANAVGITLLKAEPMIPSKH